MSMLSYQHFPIYAIMVLFFGAFLVIMLGRNKALRNTIALLAVTASLALTEMAAWYASQGMTLADALAALFEKYGYFAEKTFNLVMPGLDGLRIWPT